MHSPFHILFSRLLGLVFTICVASGCNPIPDSPKNEEPQLHFTDKNKALCDCLDPEKQSDGVVALALIKSGADVNQNCEYTGHSETFWSLIGLANPKSYQINFTPTTYFFLKENLPMLDLCFKHGGTVDSSLIEKTQKVETWEYLFAKGWGLQHFSYFNSGIAKDPPRLEFLLAHGFGINDSINSYGSTFFYSLSMSEKNDDTTHFAYLLSKGADMNKRNPLFNVVENRQHKLFPWMLQKGAKVEGAKNNWGQTVQQYIIDKSTEDDLYDMLIALNQSGHTESLNRYENVENAIDGRNYKMLKLLLGKGVSIQNPDGMDSDKNAFEEAIIAKDSVSMQILLDARPHEAHADELIKECEHNREFWASEADYVQRLDGCIRLLQKFKVKNNR